MKIIHLQPSAMFSNCSRINWSVHPERFANDIQKLISKYNIILITCGNHNYMFSVIPSDSYSTEAFSFDETNMLMQLMPGEVESFYLKAALREFMNTFIVFNSKGDRVYPEDII